MTNKKRKLLIRRSQYISLIIAGLALQLGKDVLKTKSK